MRTSNASQPFTVNWLTFIKSTTNKLQKNVGKIVDNSGESKPKSFQDWLWVFNMLSFSSFKLESVGLCAIYICLHFITYSTSVVFGRSLARLSPTTIVNMLPPASVEPSGFS